MVIKYSASLCDYGCEMVEICKSYQIDITNHKKNTKMVYIGLSQKEVYPFGYEFCLESHFTVLMKVGVCLAHFETKILVM